MTGEDEDVGATNIRVMRGPASFHYLQVSNNPVSIPASEGWSNALIYPSGITIFLYYYYITQQ